MSKWTKEEQEAAATYLRKLLPEGTTVWTTVTSAASSGMSRWIRAFVIRTPEWATNPHQQYPQDITRPIAKVIGLRYDDDGRKGAQIHGCGMDMGFEMVYEVAGILYKDGYKLKQEWL